MVIRSLSVPVVSAPMAGGPSTPELVAAVGDAGGLGFIAGGLLPAQAVHAQIADTWSRTERPFGVNLFVPSIANTYAAGSPPAVAGPERVAAVRAFREQLAATAQRYGIDLPEANGDVTDDWDRKLDLVIRERVPVVSFTFGLPSRDTVHELQRSDTLVLVTVTDLDEARAALDADVDGLFVQGVAAGGHRGTLAESKQPNGDDVVTLVESIRTVTDLPIVGAGGIDSPRRAAEVIAAGADAVAAGTLFLLTPEAGTHLVHRRALTDPAFTETAVTRVFSGRLARALVNDYVREFDGQAPAAYPEVGQVSGALRRAAAAADDPRCFALWAGTGWRNARAVPAATVVADLASELVPTH